MKLRKLYRQIRRPFVNAWAWIRFHTYARYHMVDCRSYDYRWGYLEPSELILYASFALLIRYVERGSPFQYHYSLTAPTLTDAKESIGLTKDAPDDDVDVQSTLQILTDQYKRGVEIKTLYDWWTTERPRDLETRRQLLDKVDYNFVVVKDKPNRWMATFSNKEAVTSYREIDTYITNKEQEMLARLVAIRQHLWT